jgi:hypothetical protein
MPGPESRTVTRTVSAHVGTLLKMPPPGPTFEAEGSAAGHHGLGRLRWRAVDTSGKPLGVTGTDIAFVEDGRIAKLCVILDHRDIARQRSHFYSGI